jgi:hypothetical protein
MSATLLVHTLTSALSVRIDLPEGVGPPESQEALKSRLWLAGAGRAQGRANRISLFLMHRPTVETGCFPRAPRLSSSQAADCKRVSAP